MPGAHARPARVTARPRRGAHPTGVGWWQPPKARRAPVGPDDPTPRHRCDRPGRGTASSLRLLPARIRSRATGPEGTPPAGRPPAERGHRTRLLLAGAAITALAGPLSLFTLGYLVFAVPEPQDAVPQQVALLSFTDGSPLGELTPAAGGRVIVPIDRVPTHVRAAVLAAEDRSFYANPGFDPRGLARAAWSRLCGGSSDGATITEQYVRQALTGDEGAVWRRFRELVLAVKLAQQRTKDEVLADYLNSAYFGRGAYGIQAAARAYFGKDVADLTPGEGALLAGLIQDPARWDPATHPDRAVQRWNAVLDGMTTSGWLDRGARAELGFPVTAPRRPTDDTVPADSRGHVVAAVTAELDELGISERELARGDLRVVTTLDPRRQQQAVQAARGTLDGQPTNLRSAMVAIDPGTGGVLAYYGGDNGRGPDYARTQRLAGSTFTPFVVLAGLLRTPPMDPGEGAAALARQVGPDAVAAAARTAGITAPLDDPTPGITLGNKEVSAFDLASAYATIAAGGIWRPPHLVQSVQAADGRVLYQAAARGEQRFDQTVARNVTETMLRVAERDGVALPDGRPVAARTGTVESHHEGQRNDAWTAGFTPGLATSVWIGTDRVAPARNRTPINGPELPGTAWREFMTEALSEQPVQQFPPLEPVGPEPSTGPPTDPAGTGPTTPPTGPAPTPPPSTADTPSVTPTPRPTRSTGEPGGSGNEDDTTTTSRPSTRPGTTEPSSEPATARDAAEDSGTDDRGDEGDRTG